MAANQKTFRGTLVRQGTLVEKHWSRLKSPKSIPQKQVLFLINSLRKILSKIVFIIVIYLFLSNKEILITAVAFFSD